MRLVRKRNRELLLNRIKDMISVLGCFDLIPYLSLLVKK